MFRRQISARTGSIAFLITLTVVLGVYWRIFIFQVPPAGGGGGGGGGPGQLSRLVVGYRDVTVETFTGGIAGFRDGAGWQARFFGPAAIDIQQDGSLLVADSQNHRIRRISPTRAVATVLGSGAAKTDAASPPADQLHYPSGVAALPDGGFVASDTGNNRLIRVTSAGAASVLAGSSVAGSTDGKGAVARFKLPGAVVFEAEALWVADHGNKRIRRVDLSGAVTSPAAVPATVRQRLGDVGAAKPGAEILGTSEGQGDATPSGFHIGGSSPGVVSNSGRRYFADPALHLVLSQMPGQRPILVAGRHTTGVNPELMPDPERRRTIDDTGERAQFAAPCGVAIGPGGDLYVADYEGNTIRRVVLPGWLRGTDAPPTVRRPRRRFSGS